MSILSEQIKAVEYGKLILASIAFSSKSQLASEAVNALRHYPTTPELKMWHAWLLKGKGHE